MGIMVFVIRIMPMVFMGRVILFPTVTMIVTMVLAAMVTVAMVIVG
jgi:hypothetical protein